MGAFDKFKNEISKFINVSDAEYEDYDPEEESYEKEETRTPVKERYPEPDYSRSAPQKKSKKQSRNIWVFRVSPPTSSSAATAHCTKSSTSL